MAASTSAMEVEDDEKEDKRWSLQEEISNLFDASLNRGFRLFEEEANICPSQEEEHGDYNWYMLFLRLYLLSLRIKKKLPKSAKHMIENLSVQDVGFVTFSLSRKWLTKGNTFVFLLNTQAKIRRITDNYRKDIDELKKASKLILDIVEGWREREEHALEVHLLKFTEALEESCASLSPHILCEYLYGLSKMFNNYYSSVCKVGSVAETITLLLCEATSVVMEKCFLLLGIIPFMGILNLGPITIIEIRSSTKRPMDVNTPVVVEVDTEYDRKRKELEDRCVTPCLVSVAR
ncbi:arginine--tRNA ligase, chloroplastic/mitochondrial [Artemisia annua]|uniref:arginine--tRNA ligase n=1 Tax=Artemisia annua TaxID=35608 RepID=A0A2U1MQN5_ARTAN|nr:arginine--tRNA ligase, chloroplastic/mitochondrial [Artemisia annua]